jgi:hypothetical protein
MQNLTLIKSQDERWRAYSGKQPVTVAETKGRLKMCNKGIAIAFVLLLGCIAVGQEPLAGDIDSSGHVDFLDFNILANNMLDPGEFKDGDIDGDGVVGFSDFVTVVATYGGFVGEPVLPSNGSLGLITTPDERLFLYSVEGVRANGVSLFSTSGLLMTSTASGPFGIYLKNEPGEIAVGSVQRAPPPVLRGAIRLDFRYKVTAKNDLFFMFGTSDGVFEGPIYPSLPGDADLDGQVQFTDFVLLANNFGMAGTWGQGDFTADGLVDFPDFVVMANNFDTRLPGVAATAVSEPTASLICLPVVAIGSLGRRRRPTAGRG